MSLRPTPERPNLQRRLIGPSAVMLAGAALLVGTALLMKAVPITLTRFAALLTVVGAAWQLWVIHLYVQGQQRAHNRSD